MVIFFLGSAIDIAGLDGGGAVVAPSKPSRSIGSSQSTGIGEGKSVIGESVLSCCCWYS